MLHTPLVSFSLTFSPGLYMFKVTNNYAAFSSLLSLPLTSIPIFRPQKVQLTQVVHPQITVSFKRKYQNDYVIVWLCNCVPMWLVTVWLYDCETVSLCDYATATVWLWLRDCFTMKLGDYVTMWPCDYVTVWLCDLWSCDYVTRRLCDCAIVWLRDCVTVTMRLCGYLTDYVTCDYVAVTMWLCDYLTDYVTMWLWLCNCVTMWLWLCYYAVLSHNAPAVRASDWQK
jgi:hypothetical protein